MSRHGLQNSNGTFQGGITIALYLQKIIYSFFTDYKDINGNNKYLPMTKQHSSRVVPIRRQRIQQPITVLLQIRLSIEEASTKNHLVVRQRASLVAQQIFHLAKFFVQV